MKTWGMDGTTLHGLVKAVLEQHHDKQAVIYDDGERRTRLSYMQLWDISSQVMAALSVYVHEREVVGLCLQLDHRMPAILLGVLRCKAAFYNFDVKGFEYAFKVLAKMGALILLIHQDFVQVIEDKIKAHEGVSSSVNILGLEDYMIVCLTSVARVQHMANLAYCITTSGTTGTPKIVMVPHRCIVPNVVHLRKIFSMTCVDLVLAATALTFDPSIVEIFMTLCVGACLLVVPHAVKMMPDPLLETVYERNNVTVIQMTPTLLSRFSASKLSQTILGDNSEMRVVALGGEQFPSCSWLRSLKSPGNRTVFYNLYGTTEVSCWATCYRVTEEDFRLGGDIPLGDALQGTVLHVYNDTGNPITRGEGKLYIGGSERQCLLGVSEEASYDETRLVLRDTGDIVRVEQGARLYYVGRKDLQMKRHGRRINLEEIKMVGRSKKGVHNCEVLHISDQLVLFIVLSQPASDLDAEAVSSHMREHLPSHWWPDSVIVIPNLPVNQHGKVDLEALKEAYSVKSRSCQRIGVIDYLKSRWQGLTDANIVIEETLNFIAAGGDSVRAVQFASDLEDYVDVRLPQLIDVLLHRTLGDVCKYLLSVIRGRNENGEDKLRDCKYDVAGVNDELNEMKDCKDDVTGVNDELNEMKDCKDDVTGVNDELNELKDCKYDVDVISGELSEVRTQSVRNRSGSKFDDKASGSKVNHKPFCNREISTRKRKLDEDMSFARDKSTKNFNAFQFSICRTNKVMKVNYNSEKVNNGRRVDNVENHTTGKVMKVNDDSEKVNNGRQMDNVENPITGKVMKINDNSEKVSNNKQMYCMENLTKGKSYNDKVVEFRLEEVWRYNTGKCVDASPLIAVQSSEEYHMMIGSHSHRFTMVTGSTGEQAWETTLPDRIESSACLSACANFVIVGCYDGSLYFLHVDNGNIWWQFETGSQIKCSPVVDVLTGFVYIGSHSHTVYCLNHNVCSVVWQRDLQSGSIFSSPAISYDPYVLYVATLGGKMFALNPTNGRVIWEYDFYKPVFSSPMVTRQGVCVGCTDGCLYHIGSGAKLLWKFSTDGPIFSAPSYLGLLHGYKCLSVDHTRLLHAGKQTLPRGNILPSSHTDQSTEPGSCNDSVDERRTDILPSSHKDQPTEPGSGNDSVDERRTDNSVEAGPCTMCDYIIVGSHDKCLYCVSSAGVLVWKLQVDSEVYSSPFQCHLNVNCPDEHVIYPEPSVRCSDESVNCVDTIVKYPDKPDNNVSYPDVVSDRGEEPLFKLVHSDDIYIPGSGSILEDITVTDTSKPHEHDTAYMKHSRAETCPIIELSPLDQLQTGSTGKNRHAKPDNDGDNAMSISKDTNINVNKTPTGTDITGPTSTGINVCTGKTPDITGPTSTGINVCTGKTPADITGPTTTSINVCTGKTPDITGPTTMNEACVSSESDNTLHAVIVASTAGTLYIVHVPSGKLLCKQQLDGEIFSSPVVHNNYVIVGCRNDLVYCFKIL